MEDSAMDKKIYTGPMNNELGLFTYRVYDGGLPENLSAMCEKYEAVAKAFVSLSDFAEGAGINKGSDEWKSLGELLVSNGRKSA